MAEKHVGRNYANKYKHNITEFCVAFTNRFRVIVIVAIITDLMFVGFSKSLSLGKREMLNFSTLLPPPPPGKEKECNTQLTRMTWPRSHR